MNFVLNSGLSKPLIALTCIVLLASSVDDESIFLNNSFEFPALKIGVSTELFYIVSPLFCVVLFLYCRLIMMPFDKSEKFEKSPFQSSFNNHLHFVKSSINPRLLVHYAFLFSLVLICLSSLRLQSEAQLLMIKICIVLIFLFTIYDHLQTAFWVSNHVILPFVSLFVIFVLLFFSFPGERFYFKNIVTSTLFEGDVDLVTGNRGSIFRNSLLINSANFSSLETTKLGNRNYSGIVVVDSKFQVLDLTDANMINGYFLRSRIESLISRCSDQVNETVGNWLQAFDAKENEFETHFLTDLSGTQFRDVEVRNLNLCSTMARNTKWVKVNTPHSKISNSDLSNSILDRSNFYGPYFIRVNLSGSSITSSNLLNSEIYYANFIGSFIIGSNLSHSCIGFNNFEGSSIEGARIIVSDLFTNNFFGLNSSMNVLHGSWGIGNINVPYSHVRWSRNGGSENWYYDIGVVDENGDELKVNMYLDVKRSWPTEFRSEIKIARFNVFDGDGVVHDLGGEAVEEAIVELNSVLNEEIAALDCKFLYGMWFSNYHYSDFLYTNVD